MPLPLGSGLWWALGVCRYYWTRSAMALSEETKLAFLSKHDVEHIETQFPSLRKNFDEVRCPS